MAATVTASKLMQVLEKYQRNFAGVVPGYKFLATFEDEGGLKVFLCIALRMHGGDPSSAQEAAKRLHSLILENDGIDVPVEVAAA